MARYRVYSYWTASAIDVVEAKDEDEAIELVADEGYPDFSDWELSDTEIELLEEDE